MKNMIENFINGNLKAAKLLAKRFSRKEILSELADCYGYSFKKACLTAMWLKGESDVCFQEICDCK